jgi:hypothetical protein
MTDPRAIVVRNAHAALGSRLVDLESHPNVALARTGALTGTTAAAWAEADTGLAHAWEAYRVLDQVLQAAEAEPYRAAELLGTAAVPLGDGRTGDADAALAAATAALDAAVAAADRLAVAWDSLAPRVGAARAAAAASGDRTTERTATALAELVATDPFAVTEADVAAVEAQASASGSRHKAAQVATARLDVDLARARDDLAALDADAQAAADEMAHAAQRVVGLSTAAPVPDLAALAGWLDRIAAAAAGPGDRTRVATDLAAWLAAATARRADLDAALTAARAGLKRRDDGRGLWTALRAKASARRLDEQPDVADALTRAQDLLWAAPCDLDAAEAALGQLSRVLTTRPGGER